MRIAILAALALSASSFVMPAHADPYLGQANFMWVASVSTSIPGKAELHIKPVASQEDCTDETTVLTYRANQIGQRVISVICPSVDDPKTGASSHVLLATSGMRELVTLEDFPPKN